MHILKVNQAKTLWQKVIGLIGSTKPYSLFFKTRWGIHTFGMRFPLDILILDERQCAVKLKESLKPNHVFFWNPRFNQVVELPENTIHKRKIQVGEKIKLQFQ